MNTTVKLTPGQFNLLKGTNQKRKELQAAIEVLNDKEEIVVLLAAEAAGIEATEIVSARLADGELVLQLKEKDSNPVSQTGKNRKKEAGK